MSAGFTKLFSTIITSSVWSEDDKTRIMWVTMLASADANGCVSGSVPGMAAIARMSVEDAERAIERLCSPDPYSRTKDHDGRRLLSCERGWWVVNYAKYRETRDQDKRREQTREAVRRHRQRRQDVGHCKPDVSHCKPEKAQAEAEAEAENKKASLSSSEPAFGLAELLLSLILNRKPDFKKPDLQKWAREIDRMIRGDGRAPERIEAVVRWSQADPFWQNNILSASKLREKFDQLELKMQGTPNNGQRPAGQPRPERNRDYAHQQSACGTTIEV